jgi:hypothetical protein
MTRSVHTVDQENVSATLTVAVPAARVFALLADPTTHSAIDGTGWVQEAADRAPLTEVGQIFRWIWRYDLAPLGPSETEVTLTYDWSAVPQFIRDRGIQFPPFGPEHLTNSLHHLAELAAPTSEDQV